MTTSIPRTSAEFEHPDEVDRLVEAERPDRAAATLRPRLDLALGVLAVASGVVGLWAANRTSPLTTPDGGLAPVLPPIYWVAAVTVNVALVLSLGRRVSPLLHPTLVAGLVLLLYAPCAVVGDVPRNAVAWRHLGVADAMAHGVFDPRIDVYFNWPGFFPALATFVHASGLSPVAVATWAPVANVLLWSLAIVAVVRTLTDHRDTIMLTLWLFLLGNWIDQEYLSPQALGFLLHLTVLALAMGVLGARVVGRRPRRRGEGWTGVRVPEHPDPRLRRLVFGLLLVVSVALVASHQLTPVVLTVSLTGLVVVRRCWTPLLPAAVAVVLVLWMLYPASVYLVGHPIFGAQEAGVVQANVTSRVVGSVAHRAIQGVRMELTVAMWLLAAAGMLHAWRAHRRDPRPYVLAVVPFLMLPILNYGGEMLLRVTLFSLPFVAYFGALRLLDLLPRWSGGFGRRGAASASRAVMLVVLLSVLAVASVTARYGNARFDTFTQDEVQAVDALDGLAPRDGLVVAGAASTPWAAEDYATLTRRTVQSLCSADFAPHACAAALRDLAYHEADHGGLTLLLMRANQAALEVQGQMTRQRFARFERAVVQLPGTQLLYVNRDARIYHLAPTTSSSAAATTRTAP